MPINIPRVASQLQYLASLGAAGYLRYRLMRRGREYSAVIGGKTVKMRKGTPDIEVAVSCLVQGEFECLRYLLPNDYRGSIVDAGGYIGTAALALSDLYPQASVITIEPSSQNFGILKSNVESAPNVRPVRAALVAGNRTLVSLSDRGKGHWGYSVIPGTGSLVGDDMHEEVPAIGLDRLGVEVDEIGILKLDIEGAELELFTRQADLLRRIPVIIVELHDRIVRGCGRAFFALSRDRLVIKTGGEKYLSVRR